ncbi:hypothetical protein PBAL39_20970 [Pedobacter sp. BAL39]|uniref:TlpA disulfide reductase family protein n=1 Tax=Pedobacter sp. BAL39 TaxID=391596 RepID=UPI0001559795|nr:TlpA disulfide reductase family protein [Pedobacter sp. BAL39]EDM38585.1 hypothetical protein PBAL39_20970 [Pedobacter sp. BAL39]
MIKRYLLLICLATAFQQLQAQVVDIQPSHPQRGQLLTITYHPDAEGAKINSDAPQPYVNFSFSRFYELPTQLQMQKKGNNWVASFILQRYATFASFTINSGNNIDQPAAHQHYSFAVYDGNKRVKDSYLHESYSLPSQLGKAADLPQRQLGLIHKELIAFPDNYEARLREKAILMGIAKTPQEKTKYRNEALQIIHARFEENPSVVSNLNKVTMGFLMIGENSRLDSIRKVVLQRFPNSDLAKDYRTSAILKLPDTAARITPLEALLKAGDEAGEEGSTAIHDLLFQYYAAEGNATKALLHARKRLQEDGPQTPKNILEIASLLTANKLAPDSAIAYANTALGMTDRWPVGIIRYFPEFGHIPSYVPDSVRTATIAEAKSELLSLIALNYLYKKDKANALKYAADATAAGYSKAGLMNAASVYAQTENPKQSYETLWQLLLRDPSDTVAIQTAKVSFLKFNPSEEEFNTKIKGLETLRKNQLKAALKKQLMNKQGLVLNAFTDLHGKPVSKEMMQGKIVIIDFWATWCIPCMEEMPYLQKVYDQYKSNPKVMFMVVNSGARNTIKDAQGWAAKNTKYTFPLYFNNDPNIGEKIGFNIIPTIAVIDGQGLMQFRTIGFEGAEMEHKLSAQIEVLLEQ